MEKRVDLLSAVAAVLALVGCSGPSSTGAPSTPAPLARSSAARVPASSISQDSLGAAVAANNAFAVDLYARLAPDSAAGNVLTSPISASLALTMTYAGAQGQTATEMATALHLDAVAGTAVFDGQNALSQALASRGEAALMLAQQNAQQGGQSAPSASDYELQVVNSVWGEKNYPWADPFLTILAQSYGTGVYMQDFIDQWDAAQTGDQRLGQLRDRCKINNLLPEGSLDTSTRMVLVNAIHLKFPWPNTFDPSATAASTFTRADGTTVSPSFMNQTTTFPYVDDGQAQIVGLPLSGQVSVVIALPHQGVDLAGYEAGLSVTSAALSQPRASALLALSLPKVTFTSPTFSLMASLKAMGMVQAFDMMSANFMAFVRTRRMGIFTCPTYCKRRPSRCRRRGSRRLRRPRSSSIEQPPENLTADANPDDCRPPVSHRHRRRADRSRPLSRPHRGPDQLWQSVRRAPHPDP